MDKFVVNIIHRPEMVPEYAEKVTGHGKEENIGRKALLTESLDIFRFQRLTLPNRASAEVRVVTMEVRA